jgi:hypothetical protein
MVLKEYKMKPSFAQGNSSFDWGVVSHLLLLVSCERNNFTKSVRDFGVWRGEFPRDSARATLGKLNGKAGRQSEKHLFIYL